VTKESIGFCSVSVKPSVADGARYFPQHFLYFFPLPRARPRTGTQSRATICFSIDLV
jgi:hypothetical protein